MLISEIRNSNLGQMLPPIHFLKFSLSVLHRFFFVPRNSTFRQTTFWRYVIKRSVNKSLVALIIFCCLIIVSIHGAGFNFHLNNWNNVLKLIFVNNLHFEIKFIFQNVYFMYLPRSYTFLLQRFWKNTNLVTRFLHILSAGSPLRCTNPWIPSYIIYSTLLFTVHSHLSSRNCNLRKITNLHKSFEKWQPFGDMTPCRV